MVISIAEMNFKILGFATRLTLFPIFSGFTGFEPFIIIWPLVVPGVVLDAHCHAASLLTSSAPVSAPQTYAEQQRGALYHTQDELKQSGSV